MKQIIIYIAAICFMHGALAQVSGKIVTSDSLPIAMATISLLKSNDNVAVISTRTNDMGRFQIDSLVNGSYLLKISSIGYATFLSTSFEISDSSRHKAFGLLIMTKERKELAEVVIRAEKPVFRQTAEGLTVNVENSIVTKGSTALEALQRSPGVVVNLRDNSISLNGKNGVMVMLDGKLMRIPIEQVVALLQGMSADDIASIELLSTPPSKYDADGSAGLINIVLKKNKKTGTNLNISATGGYGKGEKATGSLSLSHNTNKVNLYGSYTYSHNKTYSDLLITGSQNMPFFGGPSTVGYKDTTNLVMGSHDADLGLDYKLSANTTIGTSVAYNNSSRPGTTATHAIYNILPDSLLQFDGINKGTNTWNNFINSIYLDRKLGNNEKVNADLDYLVFKNSGSSDVQSSFINSHGEQAGDDQLLFSPRQRGDMHTSIKIVVGKVDYSKSLNDKVKLEAGIKATITESFSRSGIERLLDNAWTSNDETSDYIRMKERIGAAYFSVNSQITPKLTVVAGLRYEYSRTNMDNSKTGEAIVSRKLGSVFPNIFLSQKLNDNSSLLFSYTKRISRPSYNDLASYVGYSDPTAVYTGNPLLQPTITNNLKLGYNYKGYSLSLLFSRDDNPIARYQLSESQAKSFLYISPQNMDWQNIYTLAANLPFRITKWWTMTYNFNASFQQYKIDYTLLPFVKTYFNAGVDFSQVFKLPHGFSTEVTGNYNSISYNGTQKLNGTFVMNLGIKKELKNGGGNVGLSVTDFLMRQRYDIRYGSVNKEAYDIKSHVIVNTESTRFPIVRLTYSRAFGGTTMREKKQNSNVHEEKDRVQQ